MARVSSSNTMVLAIAMLLMTLFGQSYGQLRVGFYNGKCRTNNVEEIIFNIVKGAYMKDRTIVAALLRLQFHDCFVKGCDASILLDGSDTEKTAGPNGSVRGYELIDACKTSLEQKCPGVVSVIYREYINTMLKYKAKYDCTNITQARGRWFNVECGRRDGVVSSASDAFANLPGPTVPVPVALQTFAKNGLSAEDFVLLLGSGHSVGIIHCSFFLDRLYNYQGTSKPDPMMNNSTLSWLTKTCPKSGSNHYAPADQTPGSSFIIDNGFYKAIVGGKGLLQIDQQLALDPLTKPIVTRLAKTGDFSYEFGFAMRKLGRVGVLTGTQGQIRKNCRIVN